MPDNQLDIIVRLLLESAERDRRDIIRLLESMSQQGGQAGRDLAKGMEEGKKATKSLIQSFVDARAALQELDKFASRLGGMGRAGAQQRDLAESFDFLAERAGMSGAKLVAAMKSAAKGTLDANTIMQASNMVLGARFESTTQDYAKMVEFARLKSKQFGLSVENAFNRMVFGAVKAEVEFLDELGITLKLNDALKMYAKQLGKSTSELSSTQRSQAIWNALLIQADEQLAEIGGTVNKASDSYEQLDVRLKEAINSLERFVDASGLGPILNTMSVGIQLLVPLLTQYIALKNLAAQAAARHSASLGAENVALAGQRGGLLAGARGLGGKALGAIGGGTGLAIAGGVAAGVLGYEKLIRPLDKDLPSAADTSSKAVKLLTTGLGWAKTAAFDGADAADEWARSHLGLKTHAELAEEAQERHSKAIKEVKAEMEEGTDVYSAYVRKVQELNKERKAGEAAIAILSKKELMLSHILDSTSEKLRFRADLMDESARATGGMTSVTAQAAQGLRDHADALDAAAAAAKRTKDAIIEEAAAASLIQQAMQDAGVDSDILKSKREQIAIALGQTTEAQVENRETLEYLATAYAQNLITLDAFKEGIEAAKKGMIELTAAERAAIEQRRTQADQAKRQREALQEQAAIHKEMLAQRQELNREILEEERDLAVAVAEIQRNAARERTKAQEQYQQSVQNAHQQHAQRQQDIERNYRRRLRDIEQEYTRTVKEASIERDALAILQARERRQDQLSEAEEGRSDQLADEGRGYAEQLRGLEESYRDRLREIQDALTEEIRRTQDAHNQRIERARRAYSVEETDLAAHLRRVEALLLDSVNRQRTILEQMGGATRRNMPQVPGMPVEMQAGGSGIVTGPQTFRVEPGVTEAFWFSGAMNRGRGAAPFRGGMQAAQQVNVGGNVGVNVTGLGDSLGDRLAPRIGQMVVDALAEAFEVA